MYNIGIDGHMLDDHSGGNESYYSNILLNMVTPKDCKLYLFVKQEADVSQYEHKFQIIRFKSKNAFVRNFVELTKLCKEYKLDLLHTQYFIPFIRPCKVVCTIHDICFEHFKDIFTKKEYYRQRILIPYAAKHSVKIFTVSNHAKKDIIEHYNVAEKDVLVTYNAVNSFFRPLDESEIMPQDLRKKFGIGSENYILSVCNLQPRKNLIRLIRAFIKYKKDYDGNEKLVIVGKKAWMYNDILKSSIDGHTDIIFTDYVESDDLVRLYCEATCFIYPSFFEGFGIPPLEAMACGTPVAVAKATSLPEVVGDAGIYFDPYNEDEIEMAIKNLFNDEDVRERLRVDGLNRAKIFSWSESANLITSIYLKEVQGK